MLDRPIVIGQASVLFGIIFQDIYGFIVAAVAANTVVFPCHVADNAAHQYRLDLIIQFKVFFPVRFSDDKIPLIVNDGGVGHGRPEGIQHVSHRYINVIDPGIQFFQFRRSCHLSPVNENIRCVQLCCLSGCVDKGMVLLVQVLVHTIEHCPPITGLYHGCRCVHIEAVGQLHRYSRTSLQLSDPGISAYQGAVIDHAGRTSIRKPPVPVCRILRDVGRCIIRGHCLEREFRPFRYRIAF